MPLLCDCCVKITWRAALLSVVSVYQLLACSPLNGALLTGKLLVLPCITCTICSHAVCMQHVGRSLGCYWSAFCIACSSCSHAEPA